MSYDYSNPGYKGICAYDSINYDYEFKGASNKNNNPKNTSDYNCNEIKIKGIDW